MLRTGSVFAGRYVILEKIGTGGMADVYKAEDKKLGREVAIKVLKQELAQDAEFVRRFEDEGQAAASLNSPNIIGIYDVGNVDETYYIVMELIDGITLKDYIRRKGMLTARETMAITSQVAVGLRAAHAHHIVHRDIKPQNIILSRDGKVKVTDFGIARAITDETKSMNNTTMGSVHYIAPEQAKGAICDERSDIYSLGICMYEMITGRVPFDKETTIAVALAHMNETMIAPSELNPACPLALEQIIYRCTQKSRERRYHNCTELLQDLKIAVATPDFNFEKQEQESLLKSDTLVFSQDEVNDLRRVATEGVTAAASATMIVDDDDDPDDYEDTVIMPEKKSAQRMVDYDEDSYEDDEASVQPEKAAAPVKRQNVVPAEPRKPQHNTLFAEDKKEDEKSMFDRAILIAEIVIGALILCMLIYIIASFAGCIHTKKKPAPTTEAGNQSQENTEEETTEEEITLETIPENKFNPETDTIVPNVMGMSLTNAIKVLKDAELDFKLSSAMEYSDEYKINTVMKQSYNEGTIVRKGSTIVIMLSNGSDKFVIKPEYVGAQLSVFKEDIKNLSDVIEIKYERIMSDTIPVNQIISLDPSSGTITKGDKIIVKYCGGPEYVLVPNLLGKSRDSASGILESVGLYLGTISEDYSDEYDPEQIMSQSHAPGTRVKNGTPVDIVISLGAEELTVPDLIGEAEEDAVNELLDMGFEVTVEEDFDSKEAADTVIAMDPEPETTAYKGDTITLTVSRKKQKEIMPDITKSLFDKAKEALEKLGFKVAAPEKIVTTDINLNNIVKSQSIAPNTEVDIGTEVKCVVYVCPSIVVPDVTGSTAEQAEEFLTGIGLYVLITEQQSDDQTLFDKQVISQSILPNTEVYAGTEITLVVCRKTTPESQPTEPPTEPTESTEAKSDSTQAAP